FMASTSSAVGLNTVVSPIYQVGNGATVKLGHTVIANTNYNRLFAGGTYIASCAAPDMAPASGQRTVSAENYVGGLTLYVTIPAYHPAYVNMPGFNAAATRGMRINCVYNWSSRAVEGGYSVGVGGISFQTGNGEASEGSSQPFSMNVPALADEDEWTSCYP
ncbi:MAG TPA: hypothetical protein VIV63_02485, partial [Steroidobacteraceae bacterium]